MTKNILLLHGALGSKEQFSYIEKLLAQGFEVHAFDFSGHGSNVSNKEFSMELFVKDVLNFMKLHSLKSVSIFGYSMGGYVGLKLAANYPEKVERLMTLGTKIKWNPETAQKEMNMLDPDKMMNKIPHFTETLEKIHRANDWKTVVTKTAKMMHGLGNGNALSQAEFERIKIPVLVGRGTRDNMVTEEESKNLASRLENGNFLEVEGAKHPIGEMNVEKLAQLISDFMKWKH